MAKLKGNLIGAWAFLIGVILAVIVGWIGNMDETMIWVLLIIGIVIGLLNVAAKEANTFMIAGVVLVIVSSLGGGAFIAAAKFGSILSALLTLFVPATIIVALKTVFSIAKG